MSNQPDLPQPTSYLNVHQYLQDLYQCRKQQNPGFSYESWSRELNLKSRSYLRMVVMGKRSITESFITVFVQHMSFSEQNENYFRMLVLYSQSKSLVQKRLYEKKLIELLKVDEDRVEVENYLEFVSTPLLPRLQTLLSFDDIPMTSNALGALLNLSSSKIEASLEKLQALNLAEATTENGVKNWKTKHKLLRVGNRIGDAAIQSFHVESSKDAIQAHALPKELRKFKSLLLPLNPEEFAELFKELESFLQQLLYRYKADQLRGRRLYQANFNLFSVSEEPQD